MLKVLITGGSGFIGRNLREQIACEYEVFAPSSKDLDLLDEAAVRQYLSAHHFDVIVHAATTRSNRRLGVPADMLDRNCRMFFNLARNEGRFGKMIHFGSGAEYGPRTLLPLRVKEEFFDIHVPAEPYGFSKYICAKYSERCERLVELRLFAVFGPYEDYTVRFISNACCRALNGLPIIVRQDVLFDYLCVKDLAQVTRWFIEHNARHKAYNVSTGRPVKLTELARIVAEVSRRNSEVRMTSNGMGAEYTADNSRMLAEIGKYEFWDLRCAIGDLYSWYAQRESTLDIESLRFDEKIDTGANP